jgi:hypothetical protein
VPSIGIARALVASVVRADAELLRRALALLAAMTAVAALVVRNNRLESTDLVLRCGLVVLLLGLPIVLTRVATRVLEIGWTLGWLYDTAGASRLDRTLGGLVAAGVSGAGLGALHGVAVALWSEPALVAWLAPAEAAAGGGFAIALLGVTAASVTRRHAAPGIEPIRLIAGVVAATTLAAFTVAAGLRVGAAIGVPAVLIGAALYHLRVVRSAPCS